MDEYDRLCHDSVSVDLATGLPIARLPNDIVPPDLLNGIAHSRQQGLSFEAAIKVERDMMLLFQHLTVLIPSDLAYQRHIYIP